MDLGISQICPQNSRLHVLNDKPIRRIFAGDTKIVGLVRLLAQLVIFLHEIQDKRPSKCFDYDQNHADDTEGMTRIQPF